MAAIPIFTLLLSSLAVALPDDAGGIVSSIIDGDTFEVNGLGTVRLADVNSPDVGEPGYAEATAYTTSMLRGRPVFLDVDDDMRTDRDGRYICVAYMTYPNGTVNTTKNFNRMIADAGHACVRNYTDNEFDPALWWNGMIPASVCVDDGMRSAGADDLTPASTVQPSPDLISKTSGSLITPPTGPRSLQDSMAVPTAFIGSSKFGQVPLPRLQVGREDSA